MKHLLLLFTSCILSYCSYGQDGVLQFNEGITAMDKAAKYSISHPEMLKYNFEERLMLYSEAISKFKYVREKLPEAKEKCNYNIVYCLLYQSLDYDSLKKTDSSRMSIIEANKIWQDIDEIPYSSVSKKTYVKVDGADYLFKNNATEAEWKNTWNLLQLRLMKICIDKNKYEDALNFGKLALMTPGSNQFLNSDLCMSLADISAWKKDTCSAYSYLCQALQYVSLQPWSTEIGPEYARRVEAIMNYMKKCGCANNPSNSIASVALSIISEHEDYWEESRSLGANAFSNNESNLSLLFVLAESGKHLKKKEETSRWLDEIMQKKGKLASTDWTHAAHLYDYLADSKKTKMAYNRSKRKEALEHDNLAVGFDLFNYYYSNQYPFNISYSRPKSAIELYGSFANDGRYYMLKNIVDSVFKLDTVHYSGYQLGLNFKFYNQERSTSHFKPYTGFNLCYTNRKFNPISTRLYSIIDTLPAQTIAAINTRADLIFTAGSVFRYGPLFTEFGFGFGVGYKMLDLNLDEKYDSYETEDRRIQLFKWNKPYVPSKFMIRVGFTF